MEDTQNQFDDLNLDNQEDTLDPETLKAELAKKDDAIRQLTARAKAAEARAKEDKHINKAEPKIDMERLEIVARNPDLDDEAVDFVMRNGGKKAFDNPFVKTAIETIREQKRAEKAIPDSDTAKSDLIQGKTLEELQAMSSEELIKTLRAAGK